MRGEIKRGMTWPKTIGKLHRMIASFRAWTLFCIIGLLGCTAPVQVPMIDPALVIAASMARTPEFQLGRFAGVLQRVPAEWLDDSEAPRLLHLQVGELEPLEPGDAFLPEDIELPELYLVGSDPPALYALLGVPDVPPRAWPVVRLDDPGGEDSPDDEDSPHEEPVHVHTELIAASLTDFFAAGLDVEDWADAEAEARWQPRLLALWIELELGWNLREERLQRADEAREAYWLED